MSELEKLQKENDLLLEQIKQKNVEILKLIDEINEILGVK